MHLGGLPRSPVVARTVDVDGPVGYLDFGGGAQAPVLLCLHGLGGSALNWTVVAPLLAGSHRLIALDFAGHGRSRAPGMRGIGRERAAVEDDLRLIAALVDLAGGRVVLAGHSMGGVLGLLYARRFPHTVSRLVLVSPVVSRPTWPIDPVLALKLATLRFPGVRRVVARTVARRTPEEQVRFELSRATPHLARIPRDLVEASVREVAGIRCRAGDASRGQEAQWNAMLGIIGLLVRARAYTHLLRTLEVPVLWLHGEDDPLMPVQWARAAAAARPDWCFHTRAGVGHLPHIEDASWVAGRTLRWLARGT